MEIKREACEAISMLPMYTCTFMSHRISQLFLKTNSDEHTHIHVYLHS